jgi:hypothetical protein
MKHNSNKFLQCPVPCRKYLQASSEAAKFGPHRANCKFFWLPAKKLNIQAWFRATTLSSQRRKPVMLGKSQRWQDTDTNRGDTKGSFPLGEIFRPNRNFLLYYKHSDVTDQKSFEFEQNSWEICWACARFPLKLEDFCSWLYIFECLF